MVKNDKWIIKNALEKKIIEPFEASQVKRIDGRGVISFGTSSYGYDMRLSDEFMVMKTKAEKLKNLEAAQTQNCGDAVIDVESEILANRDCWQSSVGSYSQVSKLQKFQNLDFVLDPKQSPDKLFEPLKVKEFIIIPSNSIVLGKTVEYFRIPRDIITIAFGKSTYARCGIFVNVTPFEPEWEGYVTLSIANTSAFPVKVYANEGIAQVLFLSAQEVCETSYADRKGKYQSQRNITSARV
jgi:dCTP deaminase